MSSKGRKILVILVILAIIAVAAFFIIKNLSKEPTPGVVPPDNPTEEKSPAEQIVIKAYRIINPSKNKDIRAEVPEIVNLTNNAFKEYMNQKILKTVLDYKSEMDVMVDEDTALETLYKYVVSYQTYPTDIYLSLVVNNNYQTGGMRSNIWKDTYTINVSDNKEVFLKDLFNPEIDYKAAILKEINSQASARNYELVGGNGLSNLPDEQKYYIKDGKLIIYFDAAAIAPYVLGELEFEMPFTYNNGRFSI